MDPKLSKQTQKSHTKLSKNNQKKHNNATQAHDTQNTIDNKAHETKYTSTNYAYTNKQKKQIKQPKSSDNKPKIQSNTNQTSTTPPDLTVYQNMGTNDACNGNDNYKQCQAMTRLLVGLKYFTLLNIVENENDKEIFSNFISDIYYPFIDDYVHFNNHHSHQLEDINNEIIIIDNNQISFDECDILTCPFTTRHHNTRPHTNSHDLDDDILNFYKQTMDSFHFYLFHCFDVGIRCKKQDTKEEKEEKEEQKNDTYFDAAFSRINKMISQRQDITKEFDRFSTAKNSKFNIETGHEKEEENQNDDTTHLDTIYQYLKPQNIKQNDIRDLNDFIEKEEYDTESIEFDIIEIKDGNISNGVISDECIQKIQNLISVAKGMLNIKNSNILALTNVFLT